MIKLTPKYLGQKETQQFNNFYEALVSNNLLPDSKFELEVYGVDYENEPLKEFEMLELLEQWFIVEIISKSA